MIAIEDVMTQNPITLSRFNSLADARKLMKDKGFRHVPIVNEFGELVGLVTQRTIYQYGISSQTFMDEKELSEIETGTLLSDIMTTELTTVSPRCKVNRAAEIIHKHKFGCLPVVDADKKLKGIITDHDFVTICVQLLEMLEESEPLEDDEP
ncbi:CBS domain-containing protein [Pleionea sediminis]|uniref:CBS domain-containing protein n=1 Tax=Pleionea sediminis TaxID=2569479 RepID=UPI001185613C|nr:CBS domain-containing protein [Pleionea sediminis]